MADEIFVHDRAMEAEIEASYVLSEKSEPVPPSDIVAYNELRSCFDLYRLYSTKKLEIQPDFQRDVVWNKNEQTRFIDSLVKQLPIPSMCFSLDYKTQQWKVIDGLQRISSIINFLGQEEWQLSRLEDIHTALRGAKNTELRGAHDESTEKLLYSTVENVSIPITVIRCDYSQQAHLQYLFTIFHRLNSGGVRLNNQEIRNCIYSGSFNSTIKSFDRSNSDWAAIKKRIWGKIDRFRTVELLLRVLALSDQGEEYDGNLARFLNRYMHSRSVEPVDLHEKLAAQLAVLSKSAREIIETLPAGKIPLTIVEALLVGINSNLAHISGRGTHSNSEAFLRMLGDPAFKDAARYAITSESNVKARLVIAKAVFAAV